ncbi:hypothetical protein [Propionispora hippei]|uniref:Uncharacterized protein n=1 Tax=Propionispora hippei DSM 15287 TaxID=1123003 RepID=A0A1M6M5N7_9FIRM|nr:hypothetical protein [Propionispora hippei]SHJ78650.1 hypothetical protein SAMN02745170_03328 [Propionispora hippei DSM 15287]
MFREVNPKYLILTMAIITLLATEDQDGDELETIGNYVVAIGGVILAIASQRQSQSNLNQPLNLANNQLIQRNFDELREQIRQLAQERNIPLKEGDPT